MMNCDQASFQATGGFRGGGNPGPGRGAKHGARKCPSSNKRDSNTNQRPANSRSMRRDRFFPHRTPTLAPDIIYRQKKFEIQKKKILVYIFISNSNPCTQYMAEDRWDSRTPPIMHIVSPKRYTLNCICIGVSCTTPEGWSSLRLIFTNDTEVIRGWGEDAIAPIAPISRAPISHDFKSWCDYILGFDYP